jgi:redox-sensitive bicupin YhaK (pirin superfamily)
MSWQPCLEPECEHDEGVIDLVIEPKSKDLGGFTVRRVLPAREQRMVGPFVFFDHMGPAEFPPGEGIQVRPHPHIGLATLTYLFEGEIVHRDSLGYVQPIRPGAVNLMTAGRGIVHSERAGEDLAVTSQLHGIQSWTALPLEQEECEPAFLHHSANTLPELELDGVRVRVVVGEAYGHKSPVVSHSPMLYLELRMPEGSEIALPDDYPERAAYVITGGVSAGGQRYQEGVMVVTKPDSRVRMRADRASHLIVIGGAPLGERHVWWNFVSSSTARIEQAKADWRAGNFAPVPGETEFIPLP